MHAYGNARISTDKPEKDKLAKTGKIRQMIDTSSCYNSW